MLTKNIPSEQELMQTAGAIATVTPPGSVIYLVGMLGAGKTTFARGFLRGLGYDGKVKSPSYTLVEPYELGQQPIFHFDFYRVQNATELAQMGINDYFTAQAICLVEWPEHGQPLVPAPDLTIELIVMEEGRTFKATAHTVRGRECLSNLNNG